MTFPSLSAPTYQSPIQGKEGQRKRGILLPLEGEEGPGGGR